MRRDHAACLAVIPARGGSKRIPRKNIREFLGRPLIAYTVEAALESRVFARVIASTDDPEIAEVSRRFGAETPFMRNAVLADDNTTSSQVTADALEKVDLAGEQYVYVAQMMATCPLRNATDVQDSFRQMIASDAPSQISVTRFGWLNPSWAFRRDSQLRLAPLFSRRRATPQPGPTAALRTGRRHLVGRGSKPASEPKFLYPGSCTGWDIPWERAVDIDTQADWSMAEVLKQRQLQPTATR